MSSAVDASVLARSPFFGGVTAEALVALARSARVSDVSEGEAHGFGPERELMMILEGECRWHPEGQPLDGTRVESAGALFGLEGGYGLGGKLTMTSRGVQLCWDRKGLVAIDASAAGTLDALRTALSIRERHRELIKSMRTSPTFRNTSPALLARLLETATLVRHPRGSTICRQGEPGDTMFHVLAGEIAVVRDVDGRSERATVLYPGDTFGEMALLSGAPRSASAQALRDCEILLVRKPDFDAFMLDCASFRRAVHAMVQERTQANVGISRRVETFWFVNRTGCNAANLASLVSEQLHHAYRERSVILLCGQLDAVVALEPTRVVQLDTDDVARFGAAALAELDRPDVDYAFVVASPAAERAVALALGARINTFFFVTPDVTTPFPHAGISARSVQYLEIRDPSWKAPEVAMVRPRTVRLRLARPARDLPRTLGELDRTGRDAIARLARAATQRTVGLALSGGAAFGYAHLALLRELVAAEIPIDVIASASFGSIVGVMYASQGLAGLERLERDALEIGARAALALTSSLSIERYFTKNVPENRIDALDLPFCPVAVDIDNNRERVFRQGNLAKAVRASCSLPGIFGPTIYEGTRYVDGAVMNNVPASVAAEEGADFLIASNIVPARPRRDQGHRTRVGSAISAVSPLARVSDSLRALFLLFSATGDQQASLGADVTFSPDLAPYMPFDFTSASAIAERAREQVGPVIDEVRTRYRAMCRVSDAD